MHVGMHQCRHRGRKRGGAGGPWYPLNFKALHRNSIFVIFLSGPFNFQYLPPPVDAEINQVAAGWPDKISGGIIIESIALATEL